MLYRLVIDTPQLYESLRKGQIDAHNQSIVVEAGAHPLPVTQPKHFQNAPYFMMRFNDFDGNRISIYPTLRFLYASLRFGPYLTRGMPNTYTDYYVRFGDNAIAITDDISYILQWTGARRLLLLDKHNLAFELSQRIEEMRIMSDLMELTLSIQRESYIMLHVATFMTKLPSLQKLNLSVEALKDEEIQEFMEIQKIPKCWKIVYDEENRIISCQCVGRKSQFRAGLANMLGIDEKFFGI